MSHPLIFLTRIEQINTLLERAPHLLNEGHLIALDLDVVTQLNHLGFANTPLTRIIPVDDIYKLRQEAVKLSHTWFEGVADAFTYGGFLIPELDSVAVGWLLTELIIAREAFKRAHGEQASQIILVEVPQPRTSWGTSVPAAANAVWRFMAEQRSIPVLSFEAEASQEVKTRSTVGWRFGRLRVFLRNWLLNPMLRALLRGTKYDVLMLVYYLEGSRYDTIADALAPTFHRFAKLTTDYVHRSESPYSPAVWEPLPGLIPQWTAWRAARQMRRAFAQWMAQDYSGDDYPELFSNPYLRPMLRHYIERRFPLAAQTARMALFAFRRLHPSVVITSAALVQNQAQIVAAAEQLGIPVVTVPHSGTPTAPEITLIGDRAIVWTNDYLKLAQKAGKDTTRISVVGLPDSVVEHGYTQRKTLPSVRNEKTIVVLLAVATLNMMIFLDMETHLQALATLASIPMDLRGTTRLIFKGHPGSDHTHVYQYIRDTCPNPERIDIVKRADLNALVKRADTVVMVNMPTSAYLMPLLEGIPLLHLHTTSIPAIYTALVDWHGAMVIRNIEALWTAITGVLDGGEGRERILKDNRAFLASINPDGAPMERITQLVHDAAADRAKQGSISSNSRTS